MGATQRPGIRALTGAAGLGYVIAAAVENMDAFSAPCLGSPAGDIRAAHADGAVAAVTASAGALALVVYCGFAIGLHRLLRLRRAALVCALAGAVLAAVGLAANVVLIADGGLTDAGTRTLSDAQLGLRMLAGPLMAAFVAFAGLAALRTGALPRWTASFGCLVAAPLAVAPIALTGSHALHVAALAAFGLQTAWIWLAGLALLVGGAGGAVLAVRRAAFLMLVVAAGSVGLALLIVPGATGSFFSWALAPEPLAAFAGGVYVGSAAVYAAGIGAPRAQVRGLLAGAVVLSVSVLAITLVHLDAFDLRRGQAWAWLVLFAGFAITTAVLFFHHRGRAGSGPALDRGSRAVLAAACVGLAAVGAALWIDPVGASAAGPVELTALGGRFAGSWIVLLGVLAGWGAAAGRADEARLPALALVAMPAGALAAVLRTGAADGAYVAVLVVLVALGTTVALRARPATARARGSAPPARARARSAGSAA
jgi:hypothetical protein